MLLSLVNTDKNQAKKLIHFDKNWQTDQNFGAWFAIVKRDDTKYRCKACRKPKICLIWVKQPSLIINWEKLILKM